MGDNSKTFCGGLLKELTASVQCPWPYQSGAPSYVEWEGGTSLLRRPKYFLIPLYRISTRPSPSSPSSNTNHQPLTDSYSPSRTNLPERQSPRQTTFSRSPNFVSSLDLHTTLPFRRSPRFAASPKVCAIESGRRRLSPKSTPALNYISTGCPFHAFHQVQLRCEQLRSFLHTFAQFHLYRCHIYSIGRASSDPGKPQASCYQTAQI